MAAAEGKAILPGLGKLLGAQTTTAGTPSNAGQMGLFSSLAKNMMGKKESSQGIVGGDESPSKLILKNLTNGGEGGGLMGNKLELILNHGLKRKMGMDYLSERSGIDMRKYTHDYILHKLDKYKTRSKKTIMNRQDLIDFADQEYGVSVSMLSATDAILFCRGPQLDNSEIYNEEKLVHWLSASLPGMRKTSDKMEPPKKHHRSLTNSQDSFYLFKMSGAGTLNYNRDRLNSQRQSSTDNEKLLSQMNDALKECQKVPSLQRKVQETLTSLEQSMMDYRAQRGQEASVRARHRLREKAMKEEEAKEKSVQIMLEQTAVLDSPIRAANLQEVLKKQWCEYKDSYVIMSKLTKRQKQKLNDMIFNRYNDV